MPTPDVKSYAQCQGCKTRWKQRVEERDENGAVTVVAYHIVGPCRLCGTTEYVYEWERVV